MSNNPFIEATKFIIGCTLIATVFSIPHPITILFSTIGIILILF